MSAAPQPTHDRFNRMLRDYGSAIERLASAYEPDPNEREDLMQEIVFALWRALPAFRGECSEKTFLFRIAQNRGITHRMRRHVRDRRLVNLSEISELAHPMSESHDVVDTLSRDELLALVQRLPDMQRDVIVLSLEGLSNTEIADVLGISAGNVAVRLSRARVALRVASNLTRANT